MTQEGIGQLAAVSLHIKMILYHSGKLQDALPYLLKLGGYRR